MIKSNPLFDAIHVGVIILDQSLSIKIWNKWIAVHTNIDSKHAIGSNLDTLFDFNESRLKTIKRRIKSTLRLKSPTFVVASTEQYLFPIKLPLSSHNDFEYMQQDVTIAPYDDLHVMLLVYDQTPLMESQKREADKSKKLSTLIENANQTIKKLSEAECLLTKQRDLIFHQANYDQLTGLANRHLFEDRLTRLIKDSKRNDTSLSLLFLDIDDFKRINDTLGHNIGDEALKKISFILKNSTRESDTIVRFGGDEFLILLANTDAKDALHVANKILSALSSTIELKSNTISVSSSIGVASYPEHASSEKDLIKKADKALYAAKSQGKNRAFIYNNKLT